MGRLSDSPGNSEHSPAPSTLTGPAALLGLPNKGNATALLSSAFLKGGLQEELGALQELGRRMTALVLLSAHLEYFAIGLAVGMGY